MLRYSAEKLEEEKSISRLYFNVEKELDARKKLYSEFRRKLTDEELASLTDEDIKVPLQRYLSVMAIGFFAGKPPIYKIQAYDKEIDKLNQDLFDKPANDEQKVKEMEYIIKHVTDYNDDGKEFMRLAFDYFVLRACYEVLYKNSDSEIVYSRSNALETVAIWDYSEPANIIGLYRVIKTTLADGEYQTMVELTTATGKRYYLDTPEKRKLFAKENEYKAKYKDEPLFKEDKRKHQPPKWDDIQVIAIENEHGLNIFESVDSLIKAYERVIQNSRNTFQYNDEAILAVTGYTPQNPMMIEDEQGRMMINPARKLEDEYVLNSKVRYLQEGGKLEWILKAVNDQALQNHKKTLMDLICLCSFIPNMTDLGFTQADNNSALEKKFFALQQLISDADSDFKAGFLRRWELIFNKFNKDKGKEYDFRNVQVQLIRNMPSDSASETSRALSLRDLLSDETIIGMLPDDLDPKNEIAKKQDESEDNMMKNIERMKQFQANGANVDDSTIQEQTGKKEISTKKSDKQIMSQIEQDKFKKEKEQQEQEEK